MIHYNMKLFSEIARETILYIKEKGRGMNTYSMEIAGLVRELPYVPIDEKTAYASFVVIGDTELISRAAKELAGRIEGAEVILTAEAKGIALAYEISRLLGMKEFIVARKSVKSYMKNTICESVKSITTAGSQKLYLDETDAEKIRGREILLIDDVISTGESLRAIESLAIKAGGHVKYRAAILAEGQAAERKDIVFLKKLPLFHIGENGNYKEI
jgi:adenine phosphoribosyltransferase